MKNSGTNPAKTTIAKGTSRTMSVTAMKSICSTASAVSKSEYERNCCTDSMSEVCRDTSLPEVDFS